MLSLFAKSSAGPSFKTLPNSFQKLCIFLALFQTLFVKMKKILLVTPDFIESTRGESWRISLDTFKDKSWESITPLTNRKYCGINFHLHPSQKLYGHIT